MLNSLHPLHRQEPLLLSTIPQSKLTKGLPIRPLREVSDFVAIHMPDLLHDVRNQNLAPAHYIQQATTALETFRKHSSQDQIYQMPALAHLDACMLRESVLNADPQAPTVMFDKLIEETAAASNSIPGLTYEGLIYANPLFEDSRTFLNGNDKAAELLFYGAHYRIERFIHLCRLSIRVAMYENDPAKFDAAIETHTLPLLASVRKEMETFSRELPENSFALLRPFFSPDQRRGIKGPSGLFSAEMFCLDAICAGDIPAMREFLNRKMIDIAYYPNGATDSYQRGAGQDDMRHIMEAQTQTINNSSLSPERKTRLAKEMLAIRKAHFGLAQKFVLKPLGNDAQGTAGKPIQAFLKLPMDIYRSMAEQHSMSLSPSVHE